MKLIKSSRADARWVADTYLFMVAFGILACLLGRMLTPTPEPTPTVMPTPTPQFIALPPPQSLTNLIAAQTGSGFRYLPWYYIPDDTTVWLLFGWPEEELLYKAVFGIENDKWILLEVEKMGEETLPTSTLNMETVDDSNN